MPRTDNNIIAPEKEVDVFAKHLELLKQQSEAATTTDLLSTNAHCGASQNNHPNNSNSTKQSDNNTSTATKSNDINVTTTVVAPAIAAQSYEIPSIDIDKTNKNIQLASTSFPHTKCFRSTKSLGDARQTHWFAIHLASAVNKILQKVGINASEATIINQGKTLVLVDTSSWQLADKIVKSGQGGSVIPNSSDNCTAARVSLGSISCGLRGTFTTSILQFIDPNGETSLHKVRDQTIHTQTYISIYDMKNNLLEICDSMKGDSATSVHSTISSGMLTDWDDGNKGKGNFLSIDDVKAAGQRGLAIGNSNTLDDPQRLLLLKLTTEDDRIDLPPNERRDIMAAATKAHEEAAKLRKSAAAGTESCFEILDRYKKIIAKSKTLMAATRSQSGNDKGLRNQYRNKGQGSYVCGPQPPNCTDRPQHGDKSKAVTLAETYIQDEMDWQVENGRPVLGFRDDGGQGGEDMVRYIRIISRQQFEALKVEELTRDYGSGKKSGKKAGKKRKAAETDDRKPAAKRSSKRNKK